MRAFVDTIETKEQAISAMQAHYDADLIVQGVYHNSDGRGCAVGCHYYSYQNDSDDNIHSRAERVRIPRSLARLEDEIFEGLSESEAREWPLQYLRAINVGSDLSRVVDKFILRILEDKERGVIAFVKAGSREHSLVSRVIELYRQKLAGEHVKQEEWDAITNAVNAAVSAPYADNVDYASYAAAYHYVDAADYAAAVAAAVNNSANALEGHYAWMRDVLLSILKDTN